MTKVLTKHTVVNYKNESPNYYLLITSVMSHIDVLFKIT
jgi:hypothetical protein